MELGLAADAAHRACGALERACDQRRLAHAFASVEHCARRCASAAAVAAGAAACARLGQKARAWRALAKDGRARTKEALGDLELLKTQLEEARAAEEQKNEEKKEESDEDSDDSNDDGLAFLALMQRGEGKRRREARRRERRALERSMHPVDEYGDEVKEVD